jgi:formate-dependent nitrite reductase membrane component NrfD
MKESRLDELRAEAARAGRVDAAGVHPPGAPMPAPQQVRGYYGLPILKEPVWTWEVPVYFFVGGAAGAAAVVGLAAQLTGGDENLVRDARWIAAAGAAISTPLLIADLGRPERFLNMLRVLKIRSPMSVGAWTLVTFANASAAAAFADLLARRTDLPVALLGDAASLVAAATGLVMATYTGVLIGATVVPVWAKHAAVLPMHFGASALGSAVSLLELRGHDEPALNALGVLAAAFESWTGLRVESQRDVADEPLRRGATGITIRAGGLFSGPLPLLLRLAGARSKRIRRAAAAATLFGSLLTRMAWVEAGKASARDPRPQLEPEG